MPVRCACRAGKHRLTHQHPPLHRSPIYFGGGRVAQELFWFADSDGRELLDAFEDAGSFQVFDAVIPAFFLNQEGAGKEAGTEAAEASAVRVELPRAWLLQAEAELKARCEAKK